MKITYDKVADAQYIYIKKGKIARTEQKFDWLLLDRDKEDNVLGIEILDASKNLSQIFLQPSFVLLKQSFELKTKD